MIAKVHFHGATRTVTGSCFLLESSASRILVDCGLFQGSKTEKELNYRDFPFRPAAIDAVVLTHAHIDHSGLLPKLAKNGFRGPIYATAATADLCSVMLPDSGFIQQFEVDQLNRRNARRGRAPVEAIYTAEDAKACLDQFRPVPYESWTAVAAGVRVRFWNAGHLLGSASAEIEIAADETGPQPLRILFSGDIGPDVKLLHPPPEAPQAFDYVICESTYGDTDRQETSQVHRRNLLRNEVLKAVTPGGALLIPSFAVERTQELLIDLIRLMDGGEIPRIPVFIDSPLATRASQVFARHAGELEDGAALVKALNAHNVRFSESVEQSKALDRMREFHIVIAASGMCEAGRIRFRLKNWLWRADATVLLVGYQAEGTLGRILLNGASAVRIQGDEIKVRARIRSLDLYSGHADAPELAAWIRKRLPIRHDLFLVHGEDSAIAGLRDRVAAFVPAERILSPKLDEAFDLTSSGARLVQPEIPPRIRSDQVARPDWHNDLSELLLDIDDVIDRAADERTRKVILRRLRRALQEPDT